MFQEVHVALNDLEIRLLEEALLGFHAARRHEEESTAPQTCNDLELIEELGSQLVSDSFAEGHFSPPSTCTNTLIHACAEP